QQKKLDSVVAIALGAFKRRQEREQLKTVPTVCGFQQKLALSRKRIASAVAACTTLALGDIIHQLCASEEYSCRLVRRYNEVGALEFKAVSNLDDIFRPHELNLSNLYKFSMHDFRKKDENTRESKLAFLSEHPLWLTHSLGRMFQEVVPVIRGYRLPYVDSDSPMEFRVKHAALSLVLFKPFRSVADLVNRV
ncbi:hypothetical protein JG687_00012538, partial [Phytophthora cactorum]